MNNYAQTGIKILLRMPLKAFKYIIPVKNKIDWSKEKKDIIGRANWLCNKILVEPQALIKSMPKELGQHYQGEWAIYSCTHLSAALLNICKLYPEYKETYIPKLRQLVELVKHPILRKYDTLSWGEDALKTLDGEQSHVTYLSLLSWTICNYKEVCDDKQYDNLLLSCCKTMNRRILKSPDLNLPSFPDGTIFIPDMMFAIVALHMSSKHFDNIFDDTVKKWLDNIKQNHINKNTNLICSFGHDSSVRGSYAALNCYCLTLLNDFDFAKQQYESMKSSLKKSAPVTGIKEYLDKSPKCTFDVDAGPILFGFSPSGTAWSIGSATFFNDGKFRNKLLRTADIAGDTVKNKNQRHYRLGEIALVGEAVTLAMKTNKY